MDLGVPMTGFNISLATMADANSAYDAAVTHFGALAEELDRQIDSLRQERAFEGHFGMTGHFQHRLSTFSSAWLGMMDTFVEDERAFVAFLQGFSDRLTDTHDLYRETEERQGALFDDIGRLLGGGR